MEIITLGKEGNQPFPIKSDGVSRRHARITIDDMGDWVLEDLDSCNGTYVRDEKNGELRRVNKVKISPMSFICLGSDNAKGCCFYARQILKENYGSFTREYEYINEKEDEFEEKDRRLEKNIKHIRLAGPVVVILVVFGITCIPAIKGMFGDVRIVLSILSGVVPTLYDGANRKKKLREEYEKFHHCPNPLCSNKLKSSEIRDMKCAKCKK